MMQPGFYRVHIDDETEPAAPSTRKSPLGIGRRVVYVHKVARVWVTVWNPHTLRRAKIRKAAWSRIATTAQPVRKPVRLKQKVRAFMAATEIDLSKRDRNEVRAMLNTPARIRK